MINEVKEPPRWYLGQDLKQFFGYELPEGVSHKINVARAMNIPHEGNRMMVLRRAVELAREGVRMVPRYQRGKKRFRGGGKK